MPNKKLRRLDVRRTERVVPLGTPAAERAGREWFESEIQALRADDDDRPSPSYKKPAFD